MTPTEYPHIVISPEIRSGKPHINGTRITVSDVVIMHLQMGQTLSEIAEAYDQSKADLYAAVAYYYDHQEDIDRRIAEAELLADQLQAENNSPLQSKLQDIKHD